MKLPILMTCAAVLCGACKEPFTSFGPGGGGAGADDGGSGPDGGAGGSVASAGSGPGTGGSGGDGGAGGGPPCAPDAAACDGDTLLSCRDGAWVFAEDCSATGAVCAGGACETDLLALLRFEEGGGAVTADESPTALVGALSGPSWAAGHAGGALLFEPPAVVDLGNTLHNLVFPLSLSAWVYVDPNATQLGAVIATDAGANAYAGAWLTVDAAAGNTITVAFGNGGGTGPSNRHGRVSSAGIAPGEWVHVAGVIYGPNNIAVYAYGQLLAGVYSGTATTIGFTPAHFLVGNANWSGVDHGFEGRIDDVRIYSRALSGADVAALAGAQ